MLALAKAPEGLLSDIFFHLETATVVLTGAGFLLLISFTRNEAMITKALSKVE